MSIAPSKGNNVRIFYEYRKALPFSGRGFLRSAAKALLVDAIIRVFSTKDVFILLLNFSRFTIDLLIPPFSIWQSVQHSMTCQDKKLQSRCKGLQNFPASCTRCRRRISGRPC
jgi:hypothetical protein